MEQNRALAIGNDTVIAYSQGEFEQIIKALYPGVDEMTKQAAALVGMKYGLDPILRQVMVIELGAENVNGHWEKKYGIYIGLEGMEAIANRSGIRWSINLAQPKAMTNPYTNKPDIWLEGTLYRPGYAPLTDGRWFEEVCRYTKDGKRMYNWEKMPSLMHRKAVRLYLLRRGFSVDGPVVDNKTFIDEAEGEADEIIEPVKSPLELIEFIQKRVVAHYRAGHSGPVHDAEMTYLKENFFNLENYQVLQDKALMLGGRPLERQDALAIIDWLRVSADPQGELNALANYGQVEPALDGERAEYHAKSSPASNGRPWPPDRLREMLQRKAGLYRSKGDSWLAPPQDGLRGAMVGMLDKLLGDEGRHTFLQSIFGDPSSKALDYAAVKSVMDWLDKDSALASEEAKRVVMVEAGRQATMELFG